MLLSEAHIEIVHHPTGINPVLTHNRCKLGIVPDGMQKEMPEYDPAGCLHLSSAAGPELKNILSPVLIVFGKRMQQLNCALMYCEDRICRIIRYRVVWGFRQHTEAFSVPEFHRYNVLQ